MLGAVGTQLGAYQLGQLFSAGDVIPPVESEDPTVTFCVPEDSRFFVVKAENRTFTVPPDDRTIRVRRQRCE